MFKMATRPLVLLLWLTLSVTIDHCSGVTVACLACSYTHAGDGSTDRQCVTDVYRDVHTRLVNCSSGRCQTRTVYTQDYARLQSLTRDCSFQQTDSEECDTSNSLIPTCLQVCSSSECNNQQGDIWRTKHSGRGGAGSICHCQYLLVLSFLVLTVKQFFT